MTHSFSSIDKRGKKFTPSPEELGNKDKSDTSIARINHSGQLHDP